MDSKCYPSCNACLYPDMGYFHVYIEPPKNKPSQINKIKRIWVYSRVKLFIRRVRFRLAEIIFPSNYVSKDIARLSIEHNDKCGDCNFCNEFNTFCDQKDKKVQTAKILNV